MFGPSAAMASRRLRKNNGKNKRSPASTEHVCPSRLTKPLLRGTFLALPPPRPHGCELTSRITGKHTHVRNLHFPKSVPGEHRALLALPPPCLSESLTCPKEVPHQHKMYLVLPPTWPRGGQSKCGNRHIDDPASPPRKRGKTAARREHHTCQKLCRSAAMSLVNKEHLWASRRHGLTHSREKAANRQKHTPQKLAFPHTGPWQTRRTSGPPATVASPREGETATKPANKHARQKPCPA